MRCTSCGIVRAVAPIRDCLEIDCEKYRDCNLVDRAKAGTRNSGMMIVFSGIAMLILFKGKSFFLNNLMMLTGRAIEN